MTSIPQSLIDKLRAGKVVPFVGAGVSMAVRRRAGERRLFPNWKELLLEAADQLDAEGKSTDASFVKACLGLNPPRYLEAAEHARDHLGGTWVEYLKGKLDPPNEAADPESLELARSVWELGSRLVVTTNYDRVLHWACPAGLRADLGLWDIQATAEQANFLREGMPPHPTIWHLHGQIRNAADLILTPDGYERLYSSEAAEQRYEAAKATLRHMLAAHSLLFLGFSFADEHFGIELRGVADLFEGTSSTHYALVHERDLESFRAQKLPVEPIPFRDFGEPLLERISSLSAMTPGGSLLAAITSEPVLPPSSPALVIGESASYSPDNPPFFVPFRPKEERVIGREGALRAIREQLLSGRRTAIGQTASFQGLGGLGKTQLAVEYAWKYRDEYPNGVIWIHADQDIGAQLTQLAVEAKWVAPESEHRIKLESARHRLRSYSDCLIIFDNLEDVRAIEPYLPEPGASPHLLATSRTEQPSFVAVELPLLNPKQSLQLLLLEAGRAPEGPAEEAAAGDIVRQLGGLPLALEMAGAYLLHRDLLSYNNYREKLISNLRSVLRAELLSSFTRHEQDLFATLQIQAEALEEEPVLVEILDFLTWSGPVPIGISLLSSALNIPEPDLLSALALGLKLRLLEREAEKNRYGIHRLVAHVRREETPLKSKTEWFEAITRRLGDWFEARRQSYTDLPAFEAEIDHLKTWQSHASQLQSSQARRLLWLQAYPAFYRGLYQEAHDQILEAMTCKAEDADRRLEAWLWNDLGATQSSLGSFISALQTDLKALEIRRQVLGEEHPETAFSLHNVAFGYGHLGNYTKELEFALQALEIRRRTLGENHPETAMSLDQVGAAYGDMGDYGRCLKFHIEALSIRRRVLGEQHPDTADSFDSVGHAYGNLGDHQRALAFCIKALDISKHTLGEQHPQTATILSHVGSAHGNLGDNRRNLELQIEALRNRENILGKLHPETARSLAEIGSAYSSLGNHTKSLEYQLRAFEIRRRVYGDNHPDIASSLAYIGRTYRDLADHRKSQEAWLKALDIRRAVFGETHPLTAESLRDVGRVHRSLGEVAKAADFQREALRVFTVTVGEQHPETADCINSLVITLVALGQRPEAFRLLDAYLRKLPETHSVRPKLKALRNELLKEPLRPGFRQPPSKSKSKSKRHKR